MNHSRAGLLVAMVLASAFYVNCSGVGFSATPVIDGSSYSSIADDGAGGSSSTADANGRIQAYQDRQFYFAIPGATSGATYQASGLPSWATLDSTNGAVTGVPSDIRDDGNIHITVTVGGASTTLGPYTIAVTGDPLKTYQWHLTNTGQKTFAGLAGTAGEDIHLTETIRTGVLGSGIKVAVSDSGVYESHRGLAPNLIAGASRNYMQTYSASTGWTGNSTPSTSDADNAHGTAVAGLIAERGWLGIGSRGVAPFAKFAGFQFITAQDALDAAGMLTAGTYDQYTGDFDVFNYSWGDPQCALQEYDDSLRTKLKTGVTTLRAGKGAIYVRSAGNSYVDPLSDCYDGVSDSDYYLGNANFSEENTSPAEIVVAAVNAKGLSSSYSSPGSNLWISAPGGEYGLASGTTDATSLQPALLTTDFVGCALGLKTFYTKYNTFDAGQSPNTNCEHTATMNGTSGAAPITSGATALILSANPNLTWRDVKHILAATADKVQPSSGASGHPDSSQDLSGYTYEQGWVTNAAGYHFHNWYGFGRINVDNAVAMAKTYSSNWGSQLETNSGSTWKYDSGTLNVSVPAGSASGISRTLTVAESRFVEAVQIRVKAKNCIGNVGIELNSPAGTKSIIMNINSGLLDSEISSHIFLSNAFYGENSQGAWTLRLIGGASGCTTTWNNWQLNVIGH